MADAVIFIAELIGTAAFAISGVVVARKARMDVLGALVLGLVTAIGGGIIRDLLLGVTPPRALQDPAYALVALGVSAVAAGVFLIHVHGFENARRVYEELLELADSLGLAIFAVIGVQVVLATGEADNAFLAILIGIVTAVGGGMMRDMLAGEIPFVLQKRIYAVAALIGSALYYAMAACAQVNEMIAMAVSVVVTVAVRLLARHFRWDLPRLD